MATVSMPTLKDPKYMNWIRAGLGLLIVQKSISPATMRIIEDFHRSIGGVPTPLPGAISALTPPAAAAVAAPGCSCTFKDIDFKKKCMKTHCTICNPLVQLILAAHKFPTICKDNCAPCKWSTDSWEMAKAFMGPGQQEDNHGPEQTDCSNLVLLWDNCSHFSSHISDKTLLKKVRDARNAGMHSPKMTLSDAEMKSAIESMINLLQDATLSAEPDIDASSGVSELEKIRDQGMSILPEDELNVWLDQIQSLENSWEQLKRGNEPVAAFLQKNPGLLERISQEWPKLQGQVATVELGLRHVDQRVDHVEQRVDQRVDHVEQRVDQRVDHVEQKLAVLQEDVAGMKIKTEKNPAPKGLWGAMSAERMPSFNSSDLKGEMARMGTLTRNNHTLHHAPLAEATDVCSALQVLASHTQLKTICLIRGCTETCLMGVKALCKAVSSEHQPTPRSLYLGLNGCFQFKASDVLALFQAAALTHGAIEPVYLSVGHYHGPVWTEAECRSLAALLKQIRKIAIQVKGCSALEALSSGLTADAHLQHLEVYYRRGDDSGGDHSLPEFRANVQRLTNIELIQLTDWSDGRVSDKAESELRRWGQEQGVEVKVLHGR